MDFTPEPFDPLDPFGSITGYKQLRREATLGHLIQAPVGPGKSGPPSYLDYENRYKAYRAGIYIPTDADKLYWDIFGWDTSLPPPPRTMHKPENPPRNVHKYYSDPSLQPPPTQAVGTTPSAHVIEEDKPLVSYGSDWPWIWRQLFPAETAFAAKDQVIQPLNKYKEYQPYDVDASGRRWQGSVKNAMGMAGVSGMQGPQPELYDILNKVKAMYLPYPGDPNQTRPTSESYSFTNYAPPPPQVRGDWRDSVLAAIKRAAGGK